MKKILAAICSFAMVFSLAACGDTSSSSAAASTSDATTSAASTATTTGKGRTLEEIKESGKLVMLTNAEFPPYEYLGDSGKVEGVDVALCQKIADEIGVELEIVNMDFDGLVMALKAGKGDIVAAGMSITPEREKEVDFTVPYVDTTLYIVVPEGDTSVTSVDDLADKRVAVQEGTTSDLYVTDASVKEVLRYKSSSDAAAAIKSGMADVMVMDDLTAQNVSNAIGGITILEDIEVSHEQYAMAINKGTEDFLEVVNTVLQKSVDDNEVTSLISEYMAKVKEQQG